MSPPQAFPADGAADMAAAANKQHIHDDDPLGGWMAIQFKANKAVSGVLKV
jgi:hypothetical protein